MEYCGCLFGEGDVGIRLGSSGGHAVMIPLESYQRMEAERNLIDFSFLFESIGWYMKSTHRQLDRLLFRDDPNEKDLDRIKPICSKLVRHHGPTIPLQKNLEIHWNPT
jgi:hypothetical protein